MEPGEIEQQAREREEQHQQQQAPAAPSGSPQEPHAPQAPAAPPQAPALTPEAIAEIVAKSTGQSVQQVLQANQRQQQQPQFTEEDFVRTFNVFQPTPEVLAAIGLPSTPESVEAFRGVSTAIVKQAVTMAAYQMEKLKTELTQQIAREYGPARELAARQVEEQLKSEFIQANPDLKGFEPLLTEIRDRLLSQGVKFTSKEEAFKTLAGHARQIIQQMPGLAAGGQQQQQQQLPTASNGSGSRMSALTGAGQGGAGGGNPGSGGRKVKTTAETLFGG